MNLMENTSLSKTVFGSSIAGSTQVPEAKLYHLLAPSQTRLVLTSLTQDGLHDLQLVVIGLAEGEETPPPYAAIPYTWGDPAERVPLEINGDGGTGSTILVMRSAVVAI
jgi:hypothetical protein